MPPPSKPWLARTAGLARTALIRVPLALLFTAVAVELVSLGLRLTDEACASLLSSGGRSLSGLFAHMAATLTGAGAADLGAQFAFLVIAGLLSFVVWLELAVRAAAVAVAVLFLPLALAGVALPATAHWARRLAETLAALVLSKLAIVASLCLAVGVVGSSSAGFGALLQGISLLAISAVSPLALARVLPMVEGGAIAHLDGLGRHVARTSVAVAGSPGAWLSSASGGDLARPRAPAPAPSSPPSPARPSPGGPPAAPSVGERPASRPPAEPMPPPRPARPPRG